ncbi:unnamed protein product [Sphenostylis stenocarpa]|uniref:Uncharacterized protein n=1 Tax=Sphenostylis stenocarpa TaxID=92480 RepID=A0AA86SDX5_9FABA|nr:unnamed protein product [Sphenostylis stenocarpa]
MAKTNALPHSHHHRHHRRRALSQLSLTSPITHYEVTFAFSNLTFFLRYPFDSPFEKCFISRMGGFPGMISAPRVFPAAVPMNAEEALRREMEREQIRREVEKEEIRREILANEMARRRELEEEVRRELAAERALRMPMHRFEGTTFREGVSLSMNPRMRLNSPVENSNLSGGPQPQFSPEVDITQLYKQTQNQTQTPNQTQTKEDKVIKLAKPNIAALCAAKCTEVVDVDLGDGKRKEVLNVDFDGAKRKAVTSFPIDNQLLGSSLQKKPKKEWSCALCQVCATSEKGLNDHLQGKKHNVKCRKMVVVTMTSSGLDARQDSETFKSGISPGDKGTLELRKEEQPAVQKSQDLGGIDNEKETTTEKEVQETNALATRKKFKFYCAFCEVQTFSETVMQSHKNGKKHLATMKKFNSNNGAAEKSG